MDKGYGKNSFTTVNDFVLPSGGTEGFSDIRALDVNIDPCLNQREKTSISALVAYVAFTKKLREDAVLRMLCGRFSATDVAGIRRSSYDDVVRFLVDFCDSQAAAN